MATGSGKTRTVIALCDVLLQHGWVKNLVKVMCSCLALYFNLILVLPLIIVIYEELFDSCLNFLCA